MEFQYLGTAAAEGWPAVFCNCPNCLSAAKLGGRNIRTRSQALLNRELLIDLPPDTYLHKLAHGLDLSAVRYLLVTHWHMDHFYPQELSIRGAYYSHNMVSPTLDIFCAKETKDYFYQVTGWELETASDQALHWHILTPYQPVEAGPYRITPLPARHMRGWPQDHPFFYLIEGYGKAVLYSHDTGQFYEEVWDYLRSLSLTLDLISLDCNHGPHKTKETDGHMGLPNAAAMRDRLRELGLCGEHTRCIANHFSHNGGLLYDELCEKAEAEGFEVSYDGMAVTL